MYSSRRKETEKSPPRTSTGKYSSPRRDTYGNDVTPSRGQTRTYRSSQEESPPRGRTSYGGNKYHYDYQTPSTPTKSSNQAPSFNRSQSKYDSSQRSVSSTPSTISAKPAAEVRSVQPPHSEKSAPKRQPSTPLKSPQPYSTAVSSGSEFESSDEEQHRQASRGTPDSVKRQPVNAGKQQQQHQQPKTPDRYAKQRAQSYLSPKQYQDLHGWRRKVYGDGEVGDELPEQRSSAGKRTTAELRKEARVEGVKKYGPRHDVIAIPKVLPLALERRQKGSTAASYPVGYHALTGEKLEDDDSPRTPSTPSKRNLKDSIDKVKQWKQEMDDEVPRSSRKLQRNHKLKLDIPPPNAAAVKKRRGHLQNQQQSHVEDEAVEPDLPNKDFRKSMLNRADVCIDEQQYEEELKSRAQAKKEREKRMQEMRDDRRRAPRRYVQVFHDTDTGESSDARLSKNLMHESGERKHEKPDLPRFPVYGKHPNISDEIPTHPGDVLNEVKPKKKRAQKKYADTMKNTSSRSLTTDSEAISEESTVRPRVIEKTSGRIGDDHYAKSPYDNIEDHGRFVDCNFSYKRPAAERDSGYMERAESPYDNLAEPYSPERTVHNQASSLSSLNDSAISLQSSPGQERKHRHRGKKFIGDVKNIDSLLTADESECDFEELERRYNETEELCRSNRITQMAPPSESEEDDVTPVGGYDQSGRVRVSTLLSDDDWGDSDDEFLYTDHRGNQVIIFSF